MALEPANRQLRERIGNDFGFAGSLGAIFSGNANASGAVGLISKWVGEKVYDVSDHIGRNVLRRQNGFKGISAGNSLPKMMIGTGRYGSARKRRGSAMGAPYKKRIISRSRIAKKRIYNKRARTYKKLQKKAKTVIKGVVKKTLECDIPVGAYHKDWVSEMIWHQTDANTQLVFGASTRAGANTTPYTVKALEFAPFTSKKLIDAVSVCYNDKAKAMNYELTTDNFSEIKKLKVSFTYCSFEMKITNVTIHPFEVKLLRGTAKMDCDAKVFDMWDNAIDTLPWRQESAGPPKEPNVNTINMGIGGLKQLHKNYALKTDNFILRPGQTKTFRAVFKGCVDFNKHIVGTAETPSEYLAGVSQSWTFVAKPVPAVNGSSVSGSAKGTVGVTSSNSTLKAIVVETREIFKMMQPANTLDEHEGNSLVWFRDYPALTTGENIRYVTFFQDSKNEYVNEVNT